MRERLRRPTTHPVVCDDALTGRWKKAREVCNNCLRNTADLTAKQLLDLVKKKMGLFRNYDKNFDIELHLLISMAGEAGCTWIKALLLSKLPDGPNDLTCDNLITEMQAIKAMPTHRFLSEEPQEARSTLEAALTSMKAQEEVS